MSEWSGRVCVDPGVDLFREGRDARFSRIHSIFGIESRLEFHKGLIDLIAKHLFIQPGANEAIAVFAAQSAAKFQDHVADLFHHLPHQMQFIFLAQVYIGADVHAARPDMAVDAGFFPHTL